MKYFKTLGYMGIIAMAISLLSSCKEKKDDIVIDFGDTSKAIINFDGSLLTAVDNYQIRYDDQGRITRITSIYDGNLFEINYKTGKAMIYGDEAKIMFNNDGYITELSSSWNEKEYPYQYIGETEILFKYDKEGYLTGINSFTEETEINLEYKDSYTDRSYVEGTLTWSQGNLIETSYKVKEFGDNREMIEEHPISYDNTANKFLQYPIFMSSIIISDEPFNIMAAIGLFGKGPANLPAVIKNIYRLDSDVMEIWINCSFELNSNGSINTETLENIETIQYSYSPIDTKALQGSYYQDYSSDTRSFRLRNLFKRRYQPSIFEKP